MKNLLFVLFTGVLLISCEKEPKATTIDSVELYYRGRTALHSTFHVPLKFYSEGELVLDMLLWSLDSTLESGRYTICPDKISDGWGYKGNVNKTFSRDVCRWRGELIVDGYVDVENNGDTYSFDINLTGAKGKKHQAQYSGEVISKRSSEITKYLGFFHSLSLEKSNSFNRDHYQMSLVTGDLLGVYHRQLWFFFVPESMVSPEGSYNVENNYVFNAYVYRGDSDFTTVPIIDGIFTITSTNSHPPYRVDIDVMTEDGERIRGSYINGDTYHQFGF